MQVNTPVDGDEYVPTVQAEQLLAPLPDDCPSGHSVHAYVPLGGEEYVPAEHGEQLLALPVDDCPLGHTCITPKGS